MTCADPKIIVQPSQVKPQVFCDDTIWIMELGHVVKLDQIRGPEAPTMAIMMLERWAAGDCGASEAANYQEAWPSCIFGINIIKNIYRINVLLR